MKPTDLRHDVLWGQMHALTVISQVGSFTKAAQRLGLSKAAISQRIADLERAMGQTLVARTTRSVRLSEAGRQLVEQTEASFAQITQALSTTRDAVGQPRGLLRVTAPVALGRQHVAPALSTFFKQYPQIRIELDLSDRLLPLAQEGFDLAVRHCSAPPDSHVAVKLCGSRALLVASPAYLQAHGAPTHPDQLTLHACLPYLRPGPALWLFEKDQPDGGEPSRLRIPVQGPLRASNSEILRDAALDDLGLALLPDFTAAPALRQGALVKVLPDWQPVGFFGDAIYAVYPWSSATPRPLSLLIEHLRHSFAAGFIAPKKDAHRDWPGGR